MAIAPKPAKPTVKRRSAESIEHSRRDHRGKLVTMVSLRMSREMEARIEEHLKHRPGRVSRNTFIIEAIDEKLQDARK